MELERHHQGDVLLVTVRTARIDAACAIQFKDRMREVTEDAPARVLLDLGAVDFLDSSGLGAVVSAMKQLGEGSRMELAGLRLDVGQMFRPTRMDTVFTIHADAAAALGSGTDVA
mgnify:FL=1